MEHNDSPKPAPTTPLTAFEAASTVMATFPPAVLRQRIDGWTPAKQRLFCETLADCGLVRDAAAAVGMSKQSAYVLRRRRDGKAFALAWDAALYLARQTLTDEMLERAMDGNKDTITKDGEVIGERRKQDVRHLIAAITKLENRQTGQAGMLMVAADFDDFLDCIEADGNRKIGDGKSDGKGTANSHVHGFFEDRREDRSIASKIRCDEAIARLGNTQLARVPTAKAQLAKPQRTHMDFNRMAETLRGISDEEWAEEERWAAWSANVDQEAVSKLTAEEYEAWMEAEHPRLQTGSS
jgi:hypothetical protein